MQVRGYIQPLKINLDDLNKPAEYQICEDLYKICRGGSHLIFANSRQRIEGIAAQLSDFCEQNIVPNKFFPHHGSLAKELREELETRLQKETLPTTAICTMTLELGIDIGKVDCSTSYSTSLSNQPSSKIRPFRSPQYISYFKNARRRKRSESPPAYAGGLITRINFIAIIIFITEPSVCWHFSWKRPSLPFKTSTA